MDGDTVRRAHFGGFDDEDEDEDADEDGQVSLLRIGFSGCF